MGEDCPKAWQLGVSFAAGYIAGISCAVVSHPADNLVSVLNNCNGITVWDAIKKLGVVALLTRGLLLRILMVGTLTGAQHGIYDGFKVFTGIPTSGPPAAMLRNGSIPYPHPNNAPILTIVSLNHFFVFQT